MSLRRTGIAAHRGLFAANAAPPGYGPADLQSAYKLPSATAGQAETVAIVDAYDDPTAEADLQVYRKQYGLSACTAANGCFAKVNQQGQQANYPNADPTDGWEQEESLDVDMVSAICPNCHILLVEANSNGNADMYAAENEAIALGAKYVSNSWGESEYSGQQQSDKYFNHPGVVITAAAGDAGYGVSFPAASPYVTSVGGTNLTRDPSTRRGWTESAWGGSFQEGIATGAGCSAYEPKPAWQQDTGCSKRTDNDVSAVADPATGVAVYDSYLVPNSGPGWQVIGGTSAAAPIIASTYALAGAPQTGSVPASYPYLHNGGLNDITDGSDSVTGCTPAYLCTAGPGYDGPTGLGTPDGVTAFEPVSAGTVAGTVTAAGGKPISGASVQVGSYQATANSRGQYSLTVAAGTYDVTVRAYGYASKTATGVKVTAGQTITQNLTLTAAPDVTVSGTVTDASGHGWPLYAKITVDGKPGGPAFTNPYTGHYSMTLPGQTSYTLHVTPVYPGYTAKDVTIQVGTSSTSRNIGMSVDSAACEAPGYGHLGTYETFDRWSGSPEDGWTVTGNIKPGHTWAFNNPDGLGNETGGTGNFAAADEEITSDPQNTSLISPVTDLSNVTSPVIRFDTFYFSRTRVTAAVDLSLDGGQSWQNVWRRAGTSLLAGPRPVSIPVPQAAGHSAVQVRFHFTDPNGFGVWQLDNVLIGSPSCQLTTGGLAAGVITNANTGDPVNGATVTTQASLADPWPSAATGDPAITGGFYWLFSPHTGATTLTAAHAGYQTASAPVSLAANKVTHKDWTLRTGSLAITPASTSASQVLGRSVTRQLTLTNKGTAPLHVSLGTQDGGFTVLGQHPAGRGAPLQLIKGRLTATGFAAARSSAGRAATRTAGAPAAGSGSAWSPIAPYPGQIGDSAMAYDPDTGDVYSVGGADTMLAATAAGYVYKPATNTWAPIAAAPQALLGASAAFVDGTMYLMGGLTAAGTSSQAVYAYHPGSDTWTQAASMPQPRQFAATTVLAGQIYLVGGCAASGSSTVLQCRGADDQALDSVYRFDPGANKWAQLASYPIDIDYEACAGIDGQVVCAGGHHGASEGWDATYLYDPVTNTWSKGADMPVGDEGMAYAGANGKLQIAGGVIDHGIVITNQAWQYDPATSTWNSLPNDNNATWGSGGSCGFYSLGGFEPIVNPYAEVLPGYSQCGSNGGSPWLSASRSSLRLAPGQKVTVPLTLNSAKVNQPGTYTATIWAATDSPSPVQMTPVTMHVTAPAGWGMVKGTVTDASSHPLRGATIAFGTAPAEPSGTDHQAVGHQRAARAARTGTIAVQTAADGSYQWWLPGGDAPLQVSAAKDGYQPQAKRVSGWPKSAVVGFTLKADPGAPAYAGSSPKPSAAPSGTKSSAGVPGRTRSAVNVTAASLKSQIAKAAQHLVKPACPSAKRGTSTCMALIPTGGRAHKGLFAAAASVPGYGPSDLQSAYNLPSASAGSGQTVAVVDAFDDPNAEADLAVYRQQFGLPACTTANGCFEKVNQQGQQSNYPSPDPGWAEEESLDVDMVSAACPNCHILLVEANTNNDSDLDAAEDEAVALGAKYVSNSWASCEHGGETSDDQYFNHSGVAITAAGGDWGYDNYQQGCNTPAYPASSQFVTSVGGTTLTRDSSVARGWTETTWSPNPQATGSGCSHYEPKPSWQTDTGCAKRMTNDVSAVADPATGVAVYDSYQNGGWFPAGVGGTSAATPIIAATYALAAVPQAGTYPASYPYLNAAGLNDVTSGTNDAQSCTPAYFCTAGPGYDGPTGLGTPNGTAAFTSVAAGTLTGTVTDEATGKPVSGARVSASTFTTQTDSSGRYSVTVAAGTYNVTAQAFGYAAKTLSGVQVDAGQTTTQDFALTAVSSVTLSGTIADGSGHKWPLYAKITISSDPNGPIYSDPYTGHYSVTLPAKATYTLQVTPLYPGYSATGQTVHIGTSNVQQNIKVKADPTTCSAPGYGYAVHGTYEPFTGWAAPGGYSTTPHNGWTISTSTSLGWQFYGDPSVPNLAGGTGGEAIIAPTLSNGRTQDSTLESPSIDLTGNSSPQLSFEQLYLTGADDHVDLSLDDGHTWQNVWQGSGLLASSLVTVPLPQAAGHSDVRIRFHFAGGGYSLWAIDNVLVGTRPCRPAPGGLAAGVVTDANTGGPVNGVTVSTTSPVQSATTAPTSDPATPGGFYALFSPHTGSAALAATDAGYQTATAAVNISADAVAHQDWVLKAGRLTVSTSSLSATQTLGRSATRQVTFTNSGTASLHVGLGTQDGKFTPASLTAAPAHASPRPAAGHPVPGALPASPVTRHPVRSPASGSAWADIASYPNPVAGNAVAYDPPTGDVYSVGGISAFSSSGVTTADGYVYQPSTRKWSPIAPAPQARYSSAAAYLGGTIYLIGGFDSNNDPTSAVYAYNPGGNWTQVASLPRPIGGAAAAVLGGQLYVVGGDLGSSNSQPTDSVERYDPATNTWTQLASYPKPVESEACGGIDGELACAGGQAFTPPSLSAVALNSTFIYNPASNTWTQAADMPYTGYAMGYSTANGQLQVIGGENWEGAQNTSTLLSNASQYNPATNTWTTLPSLPTPAAFVGAGCGLYAVGGGTGVNAGGGALSSAETLRGYDSQCDGAGQPPWLSASRTGLDLAPGQSVTVTVTLDSAKVTQPGTFTGSLWAEASTPYLTKPLTVTMQVNPPSTWSLLQGTVKDASGQPLAGATIQVGTKCTGPGQCAGTAYTVKTDSSGYYQWWLNDKDNTLQVIAAKDGYVQQVTPATAVAGQAVAVNYALRAFVPIMPWSTPS